MKLVLLDRDGVVVVNRATNIKEPVDLSLVEGATEGIRRLNEAGYTVAICTNQPEVARGAMSRAQLDVVHQALQRRLGDHGARVDRIFSCTSFRKCPWRKPAGGMLREALAHYGAQAQETPFAGDRVRFGYGCHRHFGQLRLPPRVRAGGPGGPAAGRAAFS